MGKTINVTRLTPGTVLRNGETVLRVAEFKGTWSVSTNETTRHYLADSRIGLRDDDE